MSRKTSKTRPGDPTAKDDTTPLSDEQLAEVQGGDLGDFLGIQKTHVTTTQETTASSIQKKAGDTDNDIISKI